MERGKKWWIGLVLLGLMFAIVLSHPTFEDSWTVWQMPMAGQVVVLDAGHGGQDSGAVSTNGLLEKEIALSITQKLRDYLQQAGAYVVMTREADQDLAAEQTKGYRKRKVEDLKARVQLTKDTSPDFMVSIHLNSIGSPRWYGAQTFYNPTFEESERLAHLIQHRLIQDLANTTRVAKRDNDIFLLKHVRVPAVMVEVGFLSNPNEAELLGNEDYQSKVASSIYKGIVSYFAGEQIPNEAE